MSAKTAVVVPVRGFTTRIYVRCYNVECASRAIGTFVKGISILGAGTYNTEKLTG